MTLSLTVSPTGLKLDTPDGPCGYYKRCGVKKVMAGAVMRHGDLLADDVRKLGGKVQLLWRGADADFPWNPRMDEGRPGGDYGGGLPLHGYSSDKDHFDIAMPDFTFYEYPDVQSEKVNESWSNLWTEVSQRLLRRAPRRKKKGFVFRGHENPSGSRKDLDRFTSEVSWLQTDLGAVTSMLSSSPPGDIAEVLKQFAPDGFNVSVGDPVPKDEWMSLYDQCDWTYGFHVPGVSYSAGLKYRLACGQTVFFVGKARDQDEEFWYDSLVDQRNVLFLDASAGVDTFWQSMKDALTLSIDEAEKRASTVARNGQITASSYLSESGIDCYIMLYLKNYYLPFLVDHWRDAMPS